MPEISESQGRYIILVHGGIALTPEDESPARFDILERVVRRAREQLEAGATALDAVVDAVVVLEDSGAFVAGKGSNLNTSGFVETDASLMQGHTGQAGAVAAMQRLKNPIRAARIVMEDTPHVLMAGATGEGVLVGLGAETVDDPATYFTPARDAPDTASTVKPGTVGAIALDRYGHLAAGTSTGGWVGKMPGRVGDSPIIGAGTFASDSYALSATGIGEYFILRSATRDIAMRAEYQGVPLQAAADHVVKELIGDTDQGEGAVIAISRNGDIVLSAANIHGAYYGYASDSLEVTVGLESP